MINALAANNRKLVVIIDPHIKKDPDYKVYKEGVEKGFFIQNYNGSVYYGKYEKSKSHYLYIRTPQIEKLFIWFYS